MNRPSSSPRHIWDPCFISGPKRIWDPCYPLFDPFLYPRCSKPNRRNERNWWQRPKWSCPCSLVFDFLRFYTSICFRAPVNVNASSAVLTTLRGFYLLNIRNYMNTNRFPFIIHPPERKKAIVFGTLEREKLPRSAAAAMQPLFSAKEGFTFLRASPPSDRPPHRSQSDPNFHRPSTYTIINVSVDDPTVNRWGTLRFPFWWPGIRTHTFEGTAKRVHAMERCHEGSSSCFLDEWRGALVYSLLLMLFDF